MSLYERLADDLKTAQKAGDAVRVGVLRFALAQIKNREIERRGSGAAIGDADIIDVLQKEAKRRREAISLFRKGGREDLATKEEAEMVHLAAYLPAQMSREEIDAVIAALRAKGTNDFNGLMRAAMQELKGKADGKIVGEAVTASLNGA